MQRSILPLDRKIQEGRGSEGWKERKKRRGTRDKTTGTTDGGRGSSKYPSVPRRLWRVNKGHVLGIEEWISR